MMQFWYAIIEMLPFDWTGYGVMKTALLPVMILLPAIAPVSYTHLTLPTLYSV